SLLLLGNRQHTSPRVGFRSSESYSSHNPPSSESDLVQSCSVTKGQSEQ
uniref:Uncharacterized protein n=1 Tax=Labrus bergylta TaxID=56723 RepID=A0A3Q3EQ93_9LABR